jgi:ABC-type lipoprotein release transport system permease subunit
MGKLVLLAWRNLWRNARRTVITMAALALGCAGIIGLHSYRENVYGIVVHDITEGLIGHLQVHGQGYQEAPSISTVVKDPVQVEAALAGALPGAKAERRVMGAGLAGAKDQSAPVMIVGLLPTPGGERGLTTVVDGRDLSPTAAHEVLLGRDLARDLELKVGGELVLVSQAADGSVANDRYTVVGTFTSPSAELDQVAVVLHLKDAQDFFGMGDGVTMVVVRLPEGADREDVGGQVQALRGALDLKTLEALGWGEILPEFKNTMQSKRQGQRIIDLIVFFIVGLGVFNAMTMSTFERTREFGVMGALGTRPRRVLALIVTEALLQGVIAFTVGAALGAGVLYAIGTVDLSSVMQGDMMGARMPSSVDLSVKLGAVKNAALVAFSTVLLGGIVPALRAAGLRPVDAMRHT